MTAMPQVDDTTIAEHLDRLADTHPDHVLCRFQGASWTAAQIRDAATRLAHILRDAGLRPGDRVALMLPGHPDHVIAILALARAGLVRVPLNTALVGPALAYPFEAFAPHAVIAGTAYRDALTPVLAAHPGIQQFWHTPRPTAAQDIPPPWVREGQGVGSKDPRETTKGPNAQDPNANDRAPLPYPGPDDILAITPSSGTTGAPKGVLKSDRVLRAGPLTVLRITEAEPGETFLFWEALHHGAGVAVLIAAVMHRLTLAMQERFSASRFWAQAQAEGATRVHYLGTVLPMVLRQPEAPSDRTHGVRMAWGGGCPADLWHAIQDRFGVTIREGYGLSELTTFCTLNLAGKPGAIGRPVSWYDARIVRPDGSACAPDEPGELLLRPRDPRVGFLGYFRNEEASAALLRDGWVHTGDLVSQDADGDLFFRGRAKDSIRRRGINISAWEIERVILAHPAIAEAAMIGVPSDLGEDEIKLFIRPAEGATLTPSALLAWCQGRLPAFQMPRYIATVTDFPRTPTQRIRKNDLPKSTADCWDAAAG